MRICDLLNPIQVSDPNDPNTRASTLSTLLATSTVQYDIKLNRKTLLTKLYTYALGDVVDYPETTSSNSIGHLFHLDPDMWHTPMQDFVYSLGPPRGSTIIGV